jgi:6-pyruvoyltetrahydropterin/6-carboxytetrahydropterin synthase
MGVQYITRKGSFDAGHRVMNERMKCYNLHGHTYLYELTFSFTESKEIGYPVDFKEIKRVGCEWIERFLDHGFIANPHDTEVIKLVQSLNNKLWVMSLNGQGNYCNPTAENIAKELFLAIDAISMKWHQGLRLHEVKLWETPNCCTSANRESHTPDEAMNFYGVRVKELVDYVHEMGVVEYDDRKVTTTKEHAGCSCCSH